jgi:hypothetical protein
VGRRQFRISTDCVGAYVERPREAFVGPPLRQREIDGRM